ncbi:MAG: hypothetical protein ACM3SQ_04820, partial [Betaproteobacteria bacterium]
PSRPVAEVTPTDPPTDVSGMLTVLTDTRGRLVEFHAAPPQFDPSSAPAPPPPWKLLFDAAGLNMDAFHGVAPEWTPHDFADVRQAWEGPLADRPDIQVRVEAAAYKGRPSSFSVVGPWTRPSRMVPLRQSAMQILVGVVTLILWNTTIFGAALLAVRHVRANRADRRAATRLTLALFIGFTVGWLLDAHHTPAPDVELNRFVGALGIILLQVAAVWVLYVAIEPYARRFWPDGLLGWTRLMSGRLRDSRVGHDVLVGAALGGLIVLSELGRALVPPLLGAKAAIPPFGDRIASLASTPALLLSAVQIVYNSLESALLIALLFVALRLVVRRPWIAVALVVLILTITSDNGKYVTAGWSGWLFGLTVLAILTISVYRFGLLTLAVALVMDNVLTSLPISSSPTAWWAAPGNTAIALAIAIIAFGYYAARAGQPLFGKLVPEE